MALVRCSDDGLFRTPDVRHLLGVEPGLGVPCTLLLDGKLHHLVYLGFNGQEMVWAPAAR